MPIYEYACQKCAKTVEVFQKVNQRGPKACEKCGGKVARVLSHTSFQLKGGGWYKDLYSSTKPGASSEGESEGGAPEAKAEAKPESKPEAKPQAKAEAKGDPKSERPTATATDAKKAKPEAKASNPEAKQTPKPSKPASKR